MKSKVQHLGFNGLCRALLDDTLFEGVVHFEIACLYGEAFIDYLIVSHNNLPESLEGRY